MRMGNTDPQEPLAGVCSGESEERGPSGLRAGEVAVEISGSLKTKNKTPHLHCPGLGLYSPCNLKGNLHNVCDP